jgi:autotransporter passenger strand-loop-strand repeat protein
VLSVTTNGIISATTVFAGGEDIVGGMGQTNALAVGTVLTGAGFSNNDIIQNSGTALEFVEQGGTAIGTTVNANCDQSVFGGGLAIGTVVNAGGAVDVGSGGVSLSATLTGLPDNVANGFIFAANGSVGSALDTTVNDNAVLAVINAFASGTTVNSGGFTLPLPLHNAGQLA